jgi:hypothetical protein
MWVMVCVIKGRELEKLSIGPKCHCVAGISVFLPRESEGVPCAAEPQT